MSIAPENKARFVLFVMCIFILIFNKDTTMTTIFIFAHFGLYPPFFFLFGYPERLCLYKEMILAALLRQNSKTNMIKDRDEIFLPYDLEKQCFEKYLSTQMEVSRV